jgi:hypothetical protein
MVSICTGQLQPSDGAEDRRIRCLSRFFFVPVSGYARFPVYGFDPRRAFGLRRYFFVQ